MEQAPELWWQAVEALLDELFTRVAPGRIAALAVDGTSGTLLLTDAAGSPLGPALMYNDNRATAEAARIAACAPADSAAFGTGSGLAKLLWLLAHGDHSAARVHTQADWIYGRLAGRLDVSDANNVLKLGYDAAGHRWPAWLDTLGVPQRLLPAVHEPGQPIGPVAPALADRFGLHPDTLVAAGTTDSTAAFLATGAAAPGDAVTSLGSTLVLKVISEHPVSAPAYGVYSQPLGDLWLVGGGSNSGGAALRHFFSDAEMAALERELDPERPTGLDYYPLPAPGERFPRNDPALEARLTPRPDEDARFFQGLLEGIAAIEAEGYARLTALGAPAPSRVISIGGGAANAAWRRIRQRLLGVAVEQAEHQQAAYGSALLARRGALPSRAPIA